MWVGKEGPARAAGAQLVLDRSTSVVIETPGTTCGVTASIASRAIRHACAISSSSVSDLTRRSSLTSDEPSASRASGTDREQLDHRLRPDAAARARSAAASRARRRASPNAARPSPSSSTTIVREGASPSRWNRDEHARQHVDGLLARREEGAGDPAVGVRDVAEGREVALDPRQVLEVRARRDEDRVEAATGEQLTEPLAPSRVLVRVDAYPAATQYAAEPRAGHSRSGSAR